MKRILLCTIGCMLSMLMMAQTFTLTYKGFVDSEKPENNYLVVTFDGLTKEQIYIKALSLLFQVKM